MLSIPGILFGFTGIKLWLDAAVNDDKASRQNRRYQEKIMSMSPISSSAVHPHQQPAGNASPASKSSTEMKFHIPGHHDHGGGAVQSAQAAPTAASEAASAISSVLGTLITVLA
jgi:hypothetical protein